MNLTDDMRQTARSLFREGKSDGFPLDDVVQQFRQECHGRTTLMQMFLEIQLQAAYADGNLDREEDQLLLNICSQLGISEIEYRRIER